MDGGNPFGVFNVADQIDGVSKKKSKELLQARKQDIKDVKDRHMALPPQMQDQIRSKKTYVIRRVLDPVRVRLSRHQIERKLLSVSGAIRRNFHSRAYEKYDRLAPQESPAARTVQLHHARGTEINEGGERVLSINVAGSSFRQLRMEHNGFKGKGDKVRTAADKARFQDTYGTKTRLWLRGRIPFSALKKERVVNGTVMSAKYTLSGPHTLDFGHYDIMHLERYIEQIGKDFCRPVFDQWKANPAMQKQPLHVVLQGHSRGAVALACGSQRLVEWAREKYGPEFAECIQLEFIQRDPVPGPDALMDRYKELDLRPQRKSISGTTIYSMRTEHPHAFTPQIVRGQKRIILMADKHGVGQDTVENSQMAYDANEKYHQQAYIDANTMAAYRGTGLSDLEEGVFFRDENNVLVRARSYKEAMGVLRQVSAASDEQAKRTKVLGEVIRAWFIDNEFVDKHKHVNEIQEDHKKLTDELPALLHRRDQLPGRDYLDAIEDRLTRLQQELSTPMSEDDLQRLLNAYDAMIIVCRDYMSQDFRLNPNTADPSDEARLQDRMERVSDFLSIVRTEKYYFENISIDDVEKRNRALWRSRLGV